MQDSPTLESVPLANIVLSKLYRRKARDKVADDALLASIQAVGQLIPGIGRPSTQVGRFELLAGHRRYAALARAGIETMEIMVGIHDDESAMGLVWAENAARADLHPLDQARCLQSILKLKTVACVTQAAGIAGLAANVAARRMNLLKLSPGWQKAIDVPQSAAAMLPLRKLEDVARLSPAAQASLLDSVAESLRYSPGAEDFTKLIGYQLQSLASVPWDPDDESLSPKAGACTSCKLRSGTGDPCLWEDMEADAASESGFCLDTVCFGDKIRLFAARTLSELSVDHGCKVRLWSPGFHDHHRSLKHDTKANICEADGFNKVAKTHAGAIPAMLGTAKGLGKLIWVLPPNRSGGGGGAASKADDKKTPLTLKQKRAQLALRRQALVIKNARAWLGTSWEDDSEGIRTNTAAEILLYSPGRIVGLAITFGTTYVFDYRESPSESGKRWAELESATPATLAESMLRTFGQIAAGRLGCDALVNVPAAMKELARVVTIIPIPVAQFEAEAIAEIREPASWQKGSKE